jgi:hypothetical protein
MALTVAGLIPVPVISIPASAGSVLYDLSDAVYFVPDPIYGPPLP